jgi:DNA adenine methylase
MSENLQIDEETKDLIKEVQKVLQTKRWVPIAKKIEDKQLITGAVLIPNTVDAHGDTIPPDVIEAAAHKFLPEYNVTTTLGLMHKDMDPPLELVESYIAPIDFVLGTQLIKKGTWIITVHVKLKSIWKKVKDGALTGFSIGGKAVVENLDHGVQAV